MGELHLITKSEGAQNGSVVFVHGLGGDPFGTWRHNKEDDSFWPAWLAEDVKQARVYSFGYDAAPSAWLGSAMPLFDRAKHLLAWLEALPDGPIIFACHSLGGLVVKKALQCADRSGSDAWRKLAARTKGIAFFATPHTGSDLSGTMMRLGKLLRLTVAVKELDRNVPELRELNEWYRDNAIRLGIETISFYEMQCTSGFFVVDETSADPGIAGATSIPLDADHISIVKPKTRSALQHVRLKSFVERWLVRSQPALLTQSCHEENAKSNPQCSKLVISYKRGVDSDEQLAHAIVEGIRVVGHEAFIDAEMTIGVNWAVEIKKRITECDYLIVLLSEAAVTSEMVQAEVRLAHQSRKSNGKPAILPIRVANASPLDYELDAFLGRTQCFHWSDDRDTNRVIRALIDRVAQCQSTSFQFSPSLDQLIPSTSTLSATVPMRPTSSRDPRVLLPPGGSLKIDDGFYVRREADQQIDVLSQFSGQTICIKASRQMGKSSLLVRYMAKGKALGKRLIWIDFQTFSESELSDFPTLLYSLAQILARQSGAEFHGDLSFKSQGDITYFIEDKLLAQIDAPVVIGLDEVDRLLGRPYQSDFFSMLRLWHNARALPTSPWEDVDLALVIATEPYLLIAEADRSPFNVTPPIELRPFKRTELDSLNAAYELLLDTAQLDLLYELLAGHPYLTRLAYYRLLSPPGLTFAELVKQAPNDNGPFGEHLRSKLFQLQQHPGLLSAMRSLCTRKAPIDGKHYHRLHGAGLVTRTKGLMAPANQLYDKFFAQLR
jgi:hypothetical protein